MSTNTTAADLVEHLISNALPSRKGSTLIAGICGAQGSGKSALSATLSMRLSERGLSVAVLSLDDLYLPVAQRLKLSREVHPLLKTRGVPGTHDVPLGLAVLENARTGRLTHLPRFDKANDDRCPFENWPAVAAPLDILLFEGWCVGARPQPAELLIEPCNDLEEQHDHDGQWRNYVNAALAADYQRLFSAIDVLAFFAAPSFEVVCRWRTQQEHELREHVRRTGETAPSLMSDEEIAVFIQHFERLTRYMLEEMPARADLVLYLDEDRSVREAVGE